MAVLDNLSRFVVSVKNPDLTRYFPYDKVAEVASYRDELRAEGYKPKVPPLASRAVRSVSAICIRFSRRDELILIRGLPGSGKTTRARGLAIVGFEHFEADMFFERDGIYRYDASRIKDAHVWVRR